MMRVLPSSCGSHVSLLTMTSSASPGLWLITHSALTIGRPYTFLSHCHPPPAFPF